MTICFQPQDIDGLQHSPPATALFVSMGTTTGGLVAHMADSGLISDGDIWWGAEIPVAESKIALRAYPNILGTSVIEFLI
jgi:hypothetical protein